MLTPVAGRRPSVGGKPWQDAQMATPLLADRSRPLPAATDAASRVDLCAFGEHLLSGDEAVGYRTSAYGEHLLSGDKAVGYRTVG